jgi:hypothetical protein
MTTVDQMRFGTWLVVRDEAGAHHLLRAVRHFDPPSVSSTDYVVHEEDRQRARRLRPLTVVQLVDADIHEWRASPTRDHPERISMTITQGARPWGILSYFSAPDGHAWIAGFQVTTRGFELRLRPRPIARDVMGPRDENPGEGEDIAVRDMRDAFEKLSRLAQERRWTWTNR